MDFLFRTAVWTFPPPPPLPPENCLCNSKHHMNSMNQATGTELDFNGQSTSDSYKSTDGSNNMGDGHPLSPMLPKLSPFEVNSFISDVILSAEKGNIANNSKTSFSDEFAIPFITSKDVSNVISRIELYLSEQAGLSPKSLKVDSVIIENEGTAYKPLIKAFTKCGAAPTLSRAKKAVKVLSSLFRTEADDISNTESTTNDTSEEDNEDITRFRSLTERFRVEFLGVNGPFYVPAKLGFLKAVDPSHGPLNNILQFALTTEPNQLSKIEEYECFVEQDSGFELFEITFGENVVLDVDNDRLICEMFVKLSRGTTSRVADTVSGIIKVSARLRLSPEKRFGNPMNFLVYSDTRLTKVDPSIILSESKEPFIISLVADLSSPFFDPETKSYSRAFTCKFSHTELSILSDLEDQFPLAISATYISNEYVTCPAPIFPSGNSQQIYVEFSSNARAFNVRKLVLTYAYRAPKLEVVRFSESGASVEIFFDIPVKYVGVSLGGKKGDESSDLQDETESRDLVRGFNYIDSKNIYDRIDVNCSQLLDPSMLPKLGTGPKCKILNNVFLEIELGFNLGLESVAVGSELKLGKNMIYAAGQQFSYPLSETAKILPPINPPIPIVSLSGNVEVGSCDRFILSTLGSLGNAGRQFSSHIFFMNGIIVQQGLSSEFELPESLPPQKYSIDVEIVNWLGQKGFGKWHFEKKSTPLPQVNILGNITKDFRRSQDIIITAEAILPSCSSKFKDTYDNSTISISTDFVDGLNRLVFNWSIVASTERIEADKMKERVAGITKLLNTSEYLGTKSSSKLFIPKYMLPIGSYNLTLMVWEEMHPERVTRTPAFVHLKSVSLLCRI